MDLLHMLLDEAPVQTRAAGKFQPRAKQRPKKEASASVAAADKAPAAPEKQDFFECNNGLGGEACSDMAEKTEASGSFSCDSAGKLATRDVGADGKFQAQPDTRPIEENYGSEPSSVPGDLNHLIKKITTSIRFGTGHGSELLHIVDGSENLGVSPSQQGAQPSKQTKVDGSSDSHSMLSQSVEKSAGILLVSEYGDQLPVQCSNVTGPVDKVTCTIGMAGQLENADTRPGDAKAIPVVEADEMMFDAISGTGRRVGKFKPKPSRKRAMTDSTSIPQCTGSSSVMHPPNNEWASDSLERGSVPVLSSDDILGHPSMNTATFVSLDPSTLEQPMTENMVNALETSNSNEVPSEDASKMPEVEGSDSVKLNSHGTFNPSAKSTSSFTPDDDQRVRRSSRLLRKQALVTHLDDEPGEDTYNEGSPASDPPPTAANDFVEDVSVEKGPGRKRKIAVAENKKSGQQTKKVSEASDQQAKQTPKKFPHATRRKRRCVDRTLLETPEEEHDRLPIKDLILLAEYRERLAKKEAKASNISASSASQNPSNDDDDHNEEGFNELEHQQGSADDQTGQQVQTSSGFFNYQSFMKKEPRVKWSKQETELFYEAVQQFGTDFSMIQQLFPGRSRRQMKAKYRLEERKHPLRMSEASETRAKDLSHFERLAQQLQQAAASKLEHTKDDSEDMADKEDDPTPETNAKKPEHEKGDRGVEDRGPDAATDGSPSKAEESDYDDDMCTYQSAF